MATVPFDTHKAVKDLQDAGFAEAQAEALVATLLTTLGGNLATKDDIRDMATKDDIRDMATKADIAELRTEMKALELRLTLRLGGMVFAAAGLIIAAQKLLP